MKEAHTDSSRLRRLLVVACGVCLLAAAGAPTAAAGLGLSDTTGSGLPVPAATDVSELLDAPGELGETVTLTDVPVQTAASTLSQTTETLAQVTAPVLEPIQQAPLLPATLDTLTGATESVVTPVAEMLPALESATQPLLQQSVDDLGPVLEARAPDLGAFDDVTAAPRAEDVSGVSDEVPAPVALTPELPAALPGSISPERARLAPPPGHKALGLPSKDPGSVALPALPSVPGGHEGPTADSGRAKSSALPTGPAPFAPAGPPAGLASAFASAGAGLLLLAALAAALLLAAPGLGRRLRPRLAPWPQPIPQLSLERPG